MMDCYNGPKVAEHEIWKLYRFISKTQVVCKEYNKTKEWQDGISSVANLKAHPCWKKVFGTSDIKQTTLTYELQLTSEQCKDITYWLTKVLVATRTEVFHSKF
jgi:hypothetical protein